MILKHALQMSLQSSYVKASGETDRQWYMEEPGPDGKKLGHWEGCLWRRYWDHSECLPQLTEFLATVR